jgi:hypothetical protein
MTQAPFSRFPAKRLRENIRREQAGNENNAAILANRRRHCHGGAVENS